MSELTFAKRAIETFEICEKGPLKRFAKRCSSKISFAGFYILLCNFVRFLKTVFKDKKKCASSYFADSLQNVRICEKYENLQIHRIQNLNNANQDNLLIPLKNQENHQIHIIPCQKK